MWSKAVVTGAAGFIGGHLCQRLEFEGVTSIVGVDSLRSGDWSRTPDSVQRVERDIVDISNDEWLDILEDASVVFHLAAEKYNSSKSTPEKLLHTNVIATERLFRSIAVSGIKRTVFASSLYAYGSMGPDTMSETDVAMPITLYGASKLMGEGMLRSLEREIGMSWNVGRLFFVYGPRQHSEGGYKSVILTNFERLIRGEKPRIFGDGQQSLDYVYIDDCVDGLIKLASSQIDCQVVNIGSGIEHSVNELTAVMIKVAESELIPKEGPPDWTVGSRRVGNPEKMKIVFDWEPRTSLEDGLSIVFDWMKDKSDEQA